MSRPAIIFDMIDSLMEEIWCSMIWKYTNIKSGSINSEVLKPFWILPFGHRRDRTFEWIRVIAFSFVCCDAISILRFIKFV